MAMDELQEKRAIDTDETGGFEFNDLMKLITTAAAPGLGVSSSAKGLIDRFKDTSDDATGEFVGDRYYAKGKPRKDELVYYDNNTYDFFSNLYSDYDQDHDQTLKAQRLLTDIGYYDGELDGFYGKTTKGAIKRYLMERNDVNSVWKSMKDPGDMINAATDTVARQEDFSI